MDLKNYICTNPFIYTEITVDKQHMCCNEWMSLDIKTKGDLNDNWNSEKAISARQSMLDGIKRVEEGLKRVRKGKFVR